MGVSSGDYYSIGGVVWLCGGFKAGAEAEEAVGESGIFKDELEGGPVGGREVGAAEVAGGGGGAEFGDHGAIKFGGEVGREALEIPVVVAELGGGSGVGEGGGEVAVGEEVGDGGVFFDDAVELAWAVDGGVGVVKAVMVIGGVGEDDATGGGPDLEGEAEVLVGGAWGGEEFEVVIEQEVAAVDGGPDGGGEGENAAVVAGVDELAGVAGADFGGFEGFSEGFGG